MGGLIILFMEPLLLLLGSSSNTYDYARDYLIYIALGAPFILFANTFGHAVRGEGAAKESIYPGVLIRNPDVAGRVSAVGVPAGMNSALMSVATVLLNNALVSFGDKPLAAMGIVTKAYMLIAFIHMGIANGVQPLLGLSIVISLVLLFGCLKKAGTFVPSEQKAMEK